MRRIYFVPNHMAGQDDLAHQNNVYQLSIPDLTLSVELWESAYETIMAQPVGKIFHDLWRHHFGAEAEMRISGIDLKNLENGIKKLLKNRAISIELIDFISSLARMSASARAKDYLMIVIAE